MIKTVRELIAELEQIENKDSPIEVAIRQYNKAYPVAYTPILNHVNFNGSTYWIVTTLPNKVHTVGIKDTV